LVEFREIIEKIKKSSMGWTMQILQIILNSLAFSKNIFNIKIALRSESYFL
jgi:hypothetical protein